jgi:hypothetical protein
MFVAIMCAICRVTTKVCDQNTMFNLQKLSLFRVPCPIKGRTHLNDIIFMYSLEKIKKHDSSRFLIHYSHDIMKKLQYESSGTLPAVSF